MKVGTASVRNEALLSARIGSGVLRRWLDPLKDTCAPAGHVQWLDGWRGLCILLVLLGHFAPQLLGRLAPVGVEMFFVLSGRLMANVLILRRQALPIFILRRISRVVPLLALYTGIISVGLVAATLVAGTPVNWHSPVASLFFFSNYLADPAPLLEHTWSLAVEEHSYLLLVLVAAVSARRPAVAGWIACAVAIVMIGNGAMLFDAGGGIDTFWRSDVRGASVLFSFALCLLLRDWQFGSLPGRAWLSPLCLAAATMCLIVVNPTTPLGMTACTVCAAIAVNTIQFAVPAYRQVLSSRQLTWLVALSFSLYIWQQPFFLATKGDLPAVIAVPMVFGCAIWSFLRVEGPARRSLNRRWACVTAPARPGTRAH